MKTKITQLATIIFFALFFLGGNVNAEGTEHNASSHESIEQGLELENWMVNDDLWNMDGTVTLESVNEESLELECWMVNDQTWEVENKIVVETEKEQTLAFEPWMTNENIWNR